MPAFWALCFLFSNAQMPHRINRREFKQNGINCEPKLAVWSFLLKTKYHILEKQFSIL